MRASVAGHLCVGRPPTENTLRDTFRGPTHVRAITEDTFQYFEFPADCGIRTNFKIEKITYDVRNPFRWCPHTYRNDVGDTSGMLSILRSATLRIVKD